jgi:putative ATP-dependent endonuclease of OLD family
MAMRIFKVVIENFRGISKATVDLGIRTLIVGENNVGKTTVLEAINLVLGPERISSPDSINEHDFFRGAYQSPPVTDEDIAAGFQPTQPRIYVEVILGELSDEDVARFRDHIEPWNAAEERPFTAEEMDSTPGSEAADPAYILRLGFRGWYDKDEDEFRAETFYVASTTEDETAFLSKRDKQRLGFLYLRSLRTASRAASLQRGSLLDILLDLREARPTVWESVIARLHDLGGALETDDAFRGVLVDLEQRIQRYLPKVGTDRWKNTLFVSDLTRQKLRGIMTYFLETAPGENLVPYDRLVSGTTNILVLALLSAIAEVKANVIFAMEEPEIALPPYTQRRIISELFSTSSQTIVTSHSPYVAERFLPETIVILSKETGGNAVGREVGAAGGVDPKRLRQDFRHRFAEGMLGKAVLLSEGISDRAALAAANDKLCGLTGTTHVDLEILGVTLIEAGGKDELPKLSEFFSSLGLRVFVLSDAIAPELQQRISAHAEWILNLSYSSLEKLLAAESPLHVVKSFLQVASHRSDFPGNIAMPAAIAEDDAWRECLRRTLATRKGDEYAALLISNLTVQTVPHALLRVVATTSANIRGVLLRRDDPLFAILGVEAPELFEVTIPETNDATPANA